MALSLSVRRDEPETVSGDALFQFLFEGETDLPAALSGADTRLNGAISELLSSGEAKGKLHEATTLHTSGALPTRRLLLLGAGKRDDLTPDRVSRLFGQAVRIANRKGWTTLIAGISTLSALPDAGSELLRAAVSGALVGMGRGDLYKTQEVKPDALETLILSGPNSDAWQADVDAGVTLGEAINFARELVTRPAADLTPTILAERARALGEEMGFETTILDKAALEEMGAGALLAVARGSVQEPRMIRLRYGAFPGKPTLGIVGKGITFDSGGLCIKNADNMLDMKTDMSGAAATLGAMKVIGALRPEVNVVAVCPITENMTGAAAYKPGDVVTALNGKTIEILNTDAEGRVVLADALTYAQQSGATHLVDLATLTGACVIALGHSCTGVMGGPQEWVERVIAAGNASGEPMWQLPLMDEYKEQIKSDIADVENSGGRPAGAQTGALLLREFVDDAIPWAHLDIAGTASASADTKYRAKGATGVGVRSLVRLAETMATDSPE